MSRKRKSITGTLRREGYTKNEADAIARRIRLRKRKENPSAALWVGLGVGAAVVGVGIYFLTKDSGTSTSAQQTATLSPGGSAVIGHTADGTPYTLDYAAQTACKLRQIGQTREAQFWADAVAAHGGRLPC